LKRCDYPEKEELDMMFEIDKEDLQQAENFAKSSELVELMNEEGLSFGAMALVLDAIFEKIDSIKEKFEDEEI
jgi:hypothetical protein